MAELLGWGAGGLQAYKHDQAVEAQTEMNRIAMGLEQAKLERANAEAENAAKTDAMIAEAMAGGLSGPSGGDGSEDRGDALIRMGERVATIAPERGMELMELGYKFKKEERLADQAEAGATKNWMDVQLKQADLVASTLGNAETPEQVELGMEQLRKSGFYNEGELEQLEMMASDPAARKLLLRQSMSAAEQARIAIAEARAADAQARGEASLDIQRQNAARLERMTAEQERANRAREKAGGNDAGASPTGPQVATIVATLRNHILKGKAVDPNQEDNVNATFTAAASQIFSRAQELLLESKSRTFDQAVTIAITESEAAGDWNFADTWYGGTADEPTFKPNGKTPETALPKPESGRFVAGRYYTNSDGAVAKWTGKGFEPVE